MSVLSEQFVLAKTRSQDLNSVRRLNCWGGEFKDISLIRRMPNLEILCMSLNEVTTLEDVGHCVKLRELIIRKNKIKSLSEIQHLQNLPHLENLWLEENPCCQETANYRKIVLRALPNLNVLDNIPVTQDELRIIRELGDEIYEEVSVGFAPQPNVVSSETNIGITVNELRNYSQQIDDEIPDHNQNPNRQRELFESSSVGVNDICHSTNTMQLNETIASESQTQNQIKLDTANYSLSNQTYQSCANTQSHQFQSQNHHGLGLQRTSDPIWSTSQANSNGQQQRQASIGGNSNRHPQQHWNQLTLNNNQMLPKGGKSRCANILSAVLCLIRELDYVSCEIVKTELHCRMEETMSQD